MTHITVGRWGKNPAVRFPGDIARAAGLTEGERVEIETRGGEIVLRRVVPHFTLEELSVAGAGGVAGGVRGRVRLGVGRLAVSVSRNDGAGLHSRRRRSVRTGVDPTLGREQAGRRPALVVSPAVFTEHTGFAVVCPITSRRAAVSHQRGAACGAAGRGRDPDEPHSQCRYAGSACALRRCGRGTADRAIGARQARYCDCDLRQCHRPATAPVNSAYDLCRW